MVIVTSDSCKTLVQLDDHDHKTNVDNNDHSCYGIESSAPNDAIFVATDLLLPEDIDEYEYDDDDEDDDDDDSFEHGDYSVQQLPQTKQPQPQARIYLPQQLLIAGSKTAHQKQKSQSQQQLHVDDYLRCIPQLVEAADELLANPPRQFSSRSPETFVYVAQGEIAHATSQQCDVLVSDRATTCHMLAIRSTRGVGTMALGSLAHIDGANCYENDICAILQQHRSQHQSSSSSSSFDDVIHMDIHILGGYNCETSRDISNWIMALLAQLATENKDWLRMTLRTCAISNMNDNGHACPMGRGLGLDIKTGLVFLAKVADLSNATPALHIRAARLWTTPSSSSDAATSARQLGVIHTFTDTTIQIDPTPLSSWKPFPQLSLLLQLPDHVMLQLVSTSPHAEENVEEFCQHVRLTLECLRNHYGVGLTCSKRDEPLFFRRMASTNTWTSTSATTSRCC